MTARAKVVVTFDDGTVEEFNPNRPKLLLDMERKFGVQEPERHEHIAWLAFHALVELKGKDDKFDAWIETVEDFDSTTTDSEADSGEADPS